MLHDFDIRPYDQDSYLFITGVPRSGTQFIADTFQAIGLDVQHEAFGKQGISAFLIVPHLSRREKGIIFHQVRDPLKTISSMQTIDRTWPYITEYTGISPDQGGMLHAIMRLYLLLNSEIEKYEHFRYKVEEIDQVWEQLLTIADVKQQPLPDIPKDTHTRAELYKPLGWYELEFRDAELTKYIKDMGHRYGYEVE